MAAPLSVRYAPSPTGRFHLGNLRTAWISKHWAEVLGAEWVVRFEDIDIPRVLPGAVQAQLKDLSDLGLVPDRTYLQSSRRERHWEIFTRMVKQDFAYPCFCSRKEIREAIEASASAPHVEPPLYNGRCRMSQKANTKKDRDTLPSVAWRFRGEKKDGSLDIVIARTRLSEPDPETFVPSYPFACATDDLDGKYSLLVRAWDLAGAAEPQRMIQKWIRASEKSEDFLNFPLPALFHTSLVTDNSGHRLEKRTRGVTLTELLERGFTTDQILKNFAESYFVDSKEYSEGRIFGEAEKTRTLRSLGF